MVVAHLKCQNLVDLCEFEATLICRVPGQSGLYRDTPPRKTTTTTAVTIITFEELYVHGWFAHRHVHLCICLYTHCVYAEHPRGPGEVLELELQTALSHHVGAGN